MANFKSISSPIEHKTPEAYLAELLMINKYPETKNKEYFWRLPEYKRSYEGFLINLKKHVDIIGYEPIELAIKERNLTSIESDIIAEFIS